MFPYSWHETKEAAQEALEHYFAAGEVSETEHPHIEYQQIYCGMRYVVLVD